MTDDTRPIVVGVDGSAPALAAVKWAVAEALELATSLRLVAVVDDADSPNAEGHAEEALRVARGAVDNQPIPVSSEEVIRHGIIAVALLQESHSAVMICVGSAHRSGAPLGPIVTTLAENAPCSVAIIRTDGNQKSLDDGVIAVVLDDEPDNDAVVHKAMKEGRLRHATVRQVDRRTNSWVRRFPDVRVETVAAGTASGAGRPHGGQLPQLAVVGQRDAADIVDAVDLDCHPIVGYPDCSLLFVR